MKKKLQKLFVVLFAVAIVPSLAVVPVSANMSAACSGGGSVNISNYITD